MGAGRVWTDNEITYLEDSWGKVAVKTISSKLDRTETAVILKAKRLKLGAATTARDELTANQVSNLLNIDRHTVTNWISKYELKARHRVVRSSRRMWMIKLSVLTKWLKNNQDKWDSKRLEYYALGQEPLWLKSKRKQDYINIPKRRFQHWTRKEDQLAIQLFKLGYRNKDIGKRLNRSAKSIERRLSRLDVWGTGEYVG